MLVAGVIYKPAASTPWQGVKFGLHDGMQFFLDTTMLLG